MIDWQRVTVLRDEIGEDDFDEVVELFLEEVESVLDPLDQSMTSTQLEGHFHFLKGAAMNLGFKALSDLCHAGEIAMAHGDAPALDLANLRRVYACSKSEFLTDFKARSTA